MKLHLKKNSWLIIQTVQTCLGLKITENPAMLSSEQWQECAKSQEKRQRREGTRCLTPLWPFHNKSKKMRLKGIGRIRNQKGLYGCINGGLVKQKIDR